MEKLTQTGMPGLLSAIHLRVLQAKEVMRGYGRFEELSSHNSSRGTNLHPYETALFNDVEAPIDPVPDKALVKMKHDRPN